MVCLELTDTSKPVNPLNDYMHAIIFESKINCHTFIINFLVNNAVNFN